MRKPDMTFLRVPAAALACAALCWLGPSRLEAMGGPAPAFPIDDLDSYTIVEGAISRLDLKQKPPVMEFLTESGEKLGLVIPPTAFITLNGKLIRADKLRRGQSGKLRWKTGPEGHRIVGTLELVPRERSKKDFLGTKMPKIPKPDLGRPSMPKIPNPSTTSSPVIRDLMPSPPQSPVRPVMPQTPANQETRR
jgi:hypothetical protein